MGTRIFIRIGNNMLFVKDFKTGKIFDEPSIIAISKEEKSKKIIAVGQKAAAMTLTGNVVKLSPFDSHPRVLVDDFEAAEALFRYAIRSVAGFRFIAPIVFVQVAKKLEGGISAPEIRVLQDLCKSAGARKMLFLAEGSSGGLSEREVEERLRQMKV